MRRTWMLWAAWLPICLALQGCAGVLRVPCDDARISNMLAPTAYVVKLPLTVDERLQGDARFSRLDRLLEMESVVMAADIPSTHVSLLQAPRSGQCEIDDVYDAVTENRSGIFYRRLFNSAIFVWGDVFERRGQIYLQTYMRVYWNAGDGLSRVKVAPPSGGAPLEFVGRFPTSTIAFPRRLLGPRLLDRLAQDDAGFKARNGPGPDASAVDLPRRTVSFSQPQDLWIRLTGQDGQDYWLSREGVRPGGSSWIAESEFVRAVVAYLHYSATRSAGSARLGVEALERFERQSGANGRGPELRLPLAISNLIKGQFGQVVQRARRLSAPAGVLERFFGTESALIQDLASQMATTPLDQGERPEANFTRASALADDNRDVLTLAALALIPACCEGPGAAQRIGDITRSLEAARQVDAANPEVAQNLMNWYRLLAELDPKLLPFDAAVLRQRSSTLLSALQAP